ncbi:hypothetical protein DM02DRAFT_678148 [Periconia macrospinosa]|uniref:DUF4470 domain-containing protein n=1 Tax=Periconia macrospinosa TaxID=97972 RepID=A0A2V1D017_9PLEO|nr:hypothetical protein DM02DRAFT_678148 [Periconia macrospinosa]
MFGPAYLDILTFFYPVGNTPAVCLTRNLPQHIQGHILLLGCGDVRNILFTLYSEQNLSRELEIACCDLSESILARNIILFTLALNDEKGEKRHIIWNLYYHFKLDKESLETLQYHSRKLVLVSVSSSMHEWHSTTYGRLLRFCDSSTFERVRALWRSYGTVDLDEEEEVAFNDILEKNMRRAQALKAHYIGKGQVTTGMRSAAPLNTAFLQLHISRISTIGTMGVRAMTLIFFREPTDPLLGFHLATAFAPLSKEHHSISETLSDTSISIVVKTAKLQFREWCDSFRSWSSKTLTIRFFAGDAIAFSYALHQKRVSSTSRLANIYRDIYHLESIKLHDEDLAKRAPVQFTVIDTSNLIDHLGAVNVLSATSVLLVENTPSSLYTESLVRREINYEAYIQSLLCGDFSTMTLLLDLFPLEYRTNASTSSATDEAMLDAISRLIGPEEKPQMQISGFFHGKHFVSGEHTWRIKSVLVLWAHSSSMNASHRIQYGGLINPIWHIGRTRVL